MTAAFGRKFVSSRYFVNIAVFIFLLAIITTYFLFFVHYSVNVPYLDDYYDCLYYIHIFNESPTWASKLKSILWQYNEHKQAANKLTYLLQYAILGRVDFFWLSFFGSLQLPLIAYMIWKLIKPEKIYSSLFLPIPFLFFLNISLWEASYWTVTSLANLAAITLSLAVILLNQRDTKASLILSIFLTYLLTFSFGNGILMPLLACIQVAHGSRKSVEKIIWFIMTVILITLFVTSYKYESHIIAGLSTQDKILSIIDTLHLVPTYFFILIGSGPFLMGSPIWPGITIGIIVFILIIYMLCLIWKDDRSRFYPILTCILYCMFSLILVSTLRGPASGMQHAYSSHYKMYSFLFFSVITLFFIDKIKGRMLTICFCVTMLSIPILGSLNHFPIMKKNNEHRSIEITKWALKGIGDSFFSTRWINFPEQILFMAASEKIYSPFDTLRGALYQPKSIDSIEVCVLEDGHNVISSNITNNHGRIAAGIFIENGTASFDEILLCSPYSNFKIRAEKQASTHLVFEKNKIPIGNYTIYFVSNGSVIGKAKDTLKLSGENFESRCNPYWGPRYRLALQLEKEFCKKVFK